MNPNSTQPLSETERANLQQEITMLTYLHALEGQLLKSQNRQIDTRNMTFKKLLCRLNKLHNLDAHLGACHNGLTWTHLSNMIQPVTDYAGVQRCLAHLVEATDRATMNEVLVALLAAQKVMVVNDPN